MSLSTLSTMLSRGRAEGARLWSSASPTTSRRRGGVVGAWRRLRSSSSAPLRAPCNGRPGSLPADGMEGLPTSARAVRRVATGARSAVPATLSSRSAAQRRGGRSLFHASGSAGRGENGRGREGSANAGGSELRRWMGSTGSAGLRGTTAAGGAGDVDVRTHSRSAARSRASRGVSIGLTGRRGRSSRPSALSRPSRPQSFYDSSDGAIQVGAWHRVGSRNFSLLTADAAEGEDAFREQHDRQRFRLSANFVDKFKDEKPPFGFNGLGELVFQRTYSRMLPSGEKEQWYQTVERVVNGTYNMQKRWIETHQLGWNPWRAQTSAQEMYRRIFEMKFMPPGRGLWAMGSALTEERKLYAALNNCAFVSTERLKESPSRPFCFLMDASMLGVGVGFDTRGADTIVVKGARTDGSDDVYTVPDSREGWVYSVSLLLDAWFLGRADPTFDYSAIRPAGQPIKGFGGISSGPEPLEELHNAIRSVLRPLAGQPLTVTAIVDLMNLIGKCVVSGNLRQTAEIAFGDPFDDDYVDLKDYDVNPHRAAYGWTSNNSVFAELGMDYSYICERVAKNGEPGFAWLENMQRYSRMRGIPDDKDKRALGGNPCLEQTLESYELCCLVETFPNNHDSVEDYKRTLKYAYLYAKTVTLGQTHWPVTNRVMLRNRRIGCSMSGVAQMIANRGLDELRQWSEEGYEAIAHYDRVYSDWLAIPRSIKTTCIKPSGTVSLLAGATPGMHYPESRFYLRRVRLSRFSELLEPLQRAGYEIEACVDDSKSVVVSFPVDAGKGVRTSAERSLWEQLALAAFLQRHWADNQVSCTVTFDPETEAEQLPHALNYFQYQLKGVSFLPRLETGAYPQMPYEEISEAEYRERVTKLSELDFRGLRSADVGVPDKFCDSERCELPIVVDGYQRLLDDSAEASGDSATDSDSD